MGKTIRRPTPRGVTIPSASQPRPGEASTKLVTDSNASAAEFDSLRLYFEGDGEEVVELVPPPPAKELTLGVLTPDVLPAGLERLGVIVGLNTIGQYDFQFELIDGVETHVTFVGR